MTATTEKYITLRIDVSLYLAIKYDLSFGEAVELYLKYADFDTKTQTVEDASRSIAFCAGLV